MISARITHNRTSLIEITKDGRRQNITLDTIAAVWGDIAGKDAVDIEYIGADICGSLVACCADICSGQSGIVFVWDTEKGELVHYTEGSFAVRVIIEGGKVYTIREVSMWGCEPHIELDCCKLGIKDMSHIPERFELDKKQAHTFAKDPSLYELVFSGDKPGINVRKDK